MRARCAPQLRRVLAAQAGEGDRSYSAWSSACLAGRHYLRITPRGEVTPCPYIPTVLGDLARSSLREIWERHPLLRRLRTELPAGKCGECDFRYDCGGCRARALARGGDLFAEDHSCLYLKPLSAQPEPFPACAPPDAPTWEPAAQALLARIPSFVRAMVKARLEERAAREGRGTVSADFMRTHRPPFGRFGSGAGSNSPNPAAGDPQ